MLALRAARAFDGEHLVEGGVVLLLDADRIVALEPATAAVPDGVEVVDHGDATLMPGLIDSHVHLCGDSLDGALDRLEVYDDHELVEVIERGLRRQLSAGVTTVRDLGDRRFAVVDRRDTGGTDPRPTVLASGPPITSPRGHCWNMGGEAAGPNGLRSAVAERVERGVDVIKIMTSGGMFTPGTDVTLPQFSDDELKIVVTEAHAAGLGVTAHAHALTAVEQAVRAGVDGIEHGSCMTTTGQTPPADLLEIIANRRIPVCPTLGIAADAPIPPRIAELLASLGLTREDQFAHVSRLHATGVLLVGGSDAGIGLAKPHGILTLAFVELAKCTSPAVALAAVTSIAARVCGLEDRKGWLRSGYDADVIAVSGNPLADVTDIWRLRQVILAGAIVDPQFMQT